MAEREKRLASGTISLTPKQRDSIWGECQLLAVEKYDDSYSRNCLATVIFCHKVAEKLVGMVDQESFSLRDMENFFSVPRWRQRNLIEKGISPARIKGKHFFYSKEGAKQLLRVEEFRKLHPHKRNIGSDDFLEKDNFLYWAIKRDIGVLYPEVYYLPSKTNKNN